MPNDGNLSPWLEEQQATIKSLSAGFTPGPGVCADFDQSLRQNPDAARLVQDVIPKCSAARLAGFVTLIVGSTVEQRLVELKSSRGKSLRKMIYPVARKIRSPRAQEFVEQAGKAFDVRREGLADHCFGLLLVRRYLKFRTGIEPTARELAALLKAGLAASGRPAALQNVDHDLLRRNLKNYEAKHAHPLATGERCAQIIELSGLTT